MKRKFFAVCLIVMLLVSVFCINGNLYASETPEDENTAANDNARMLEESALANIQLSPGSVSENPESTNSLNNGGLFLQGNSDSTQEGNGSGLDLASILQGSGSNGSSIGGDNGTFFSGNGEKGGSSGEKSQGDLKVVSDSSKYVMDKDVDGNVFIIGNNVKITGQITGSLYVIAGGELEIAETAWISSQVFALANSISLKGSICDMYTICDNITFGENASVQRNISVIANEIELNGSIGRDADLTASKITLPEEKGTLSISGNLNYKTDSEISEFNNDIVQGEINFEKISTDGKEMAEIIADGILSVVGTVVFDVVLYIILLFFVPKFVTKTKEYLSTRALLAFAIGAVFTVVVPILAILLVITSVGAGLALLLSVIYAIALLLNAFIVAVTVNEFLANKFKISDDKVKKSLLLVLVSAVIWGLRKIPVIGGIISVLVFCVGIGIMILYQFDKRKSAE